MDITRKMTQSATWWARTGNDGFGGDTLAAPVLIACRWEEVQQLFRSQLDRQEYVSKSIVYVDRDMAAGDWLAEGDQTAQANPAIVAGAAKIQAYAKVSDLRAANYLRKVMI